MRYVLPALMVLLLLAPTAHAQTGRWITASGNLEIEIAPCGPALCGTAVRVLANNSMSAPGTAMATNVPGLGLKILRDFTTTGDGTWTGQIYDRENGKTYRCRMRQLSADELEIHPYIGIPLFGQTQIWHRAPAATESSAMTR
jgi:uncharacterized protein (DUF2147 family)